MIWLALALNLNVSLFWTDIGSKQALVCHVSVLQTCLNQLSPHVRQQLPNTQADFRHELGRRGAMVLAVDDEDISGLVLLAPSHLPESVVVDLSGNIYSFDLAQQKQMTLWHELGHLEAKRLVEQGMFKPLSEFQHEWLADSYLIWRSAKERKSLDLAWQQYHRRNLDVIKDVSFMSHWSVPMLDQILQRYSLEELNKFDKFGDLIADLLPHLTFLNQDELNEFSSLIHRTFSPQAFMNLPNYMYWRKPALRKYFEPTLVSLLGGEGAQQWLQEQSLLTDAEPFSVDPAFLAEP